MSLAFRINPSRMRPFEKGAIRAFFDVDFGSREDGEFVPVFTVCDFTLFAKNDGSGYFVKGFEKFRKKNGETVLDDEGHPKTDPIYKAYAEESDGKYQRTKAAFQFADALTKEAVRVFESGEVKGGKKAKVAAPAGVGATIQEAEPGNPFGDVEDDDLPF